MTLLEDLSHLLVHVYYVAAKSTSELCINQKEGTHSFLRVTAYML